METKEVTDREKNKLIAEQQLEIRGYKEEIKGYIEDFEAIHGLLYTVGGPLNDNILMYSREQLSTFFRIATQIECNLPFDEI